MNTRLIFLLLPPVLYHFCAVVGGPENYNSKAGKTLVFCSYSKKGKIYKWSLKICIYILEEVQRRTLPFALLETPEELCAFAQGPPRINRVVRNFGGPRLES